MIRNLVGRLGRRRVETAVTAVVAAVAAAGVLMHGDTPADVPVSPPVATYVTAAASRIASVARPASPDASASTSSGAAALAKIGNPRVDSWITRFTTDLRSTFAADLDRMAHYSDMIVGKLDDRDMPRDLIYLALIESDFNPHAKSHAKASGMWQFMSATARRFGLTVKGKVDERTDPAKSTDAALTYLAQLKDRLGSWYLAAAAYNSGEGTVLHALKKVTGKTKGTDADFYRIASKLPKETREYVPKLVAAARIGANPARYGFSAN